MRYLVHLPTNEEYMFACLRLDTKDKNKLASRRAMARANLAYDKDFITASYAEDEGLFTLYRVKEQADMPGRAVLLSDGFLQYVGPTIRAEKVPYIACNQLVGENGVSWQLIVNKEGRSTCLLPWSELEL